MENFRRSFTHPISNTIVLDKLDISNYLSDTLTGGFNVNLLPTVLHELTHHWCFSSPVGTALSLLALESRSKLITANLNDLEQLNEIAGCELTYNFTMSMLQPLLEGMSEFAEFDLLTGESEVVSLPTSVTALLFLGRKNSPKDILEEFESGIGRYRLMPAYIERKKALFTHSFDCNKSAYLAGYLTVKAMHSVCRTKFDLFMDSDFFLMYARSFFFDDWDFVKLLLQKDPDPLDLPDQILSYFIKRIQLFFEFDHNRFNRKFEKDILEHNSFSYHIESQWVTGDVHSCPVGSNKFDKEIRDLLNYRMQEVCNSGTYKLENVVGFMRSMMLFRGAISLGHGKINVKITEGGMLQFLNNECLPMLVYAVPDEMKTIKSEKVEVDIIYLHEPPGMYAIVSEGGEIIYHFSLNKNEVDMEELKFFVNRNEMLENLNELNNITQMLAKNSIYEIYQKNATDYLTMNMNSLYGYSALIYTPDDLMAHAFSIMYEKGISSVINDSDLFHDCVVASLIWSNNLSVESTMIANIWTKGKLKTDLEEILEEINSRIKTHIGFDNFQIIKELDVIYSHLL